VSQIVIGKSDGKSAHFDINVFLRTHLLITASTGGGKSFLIRRAVEQMFGHIPIIIVDREGDFPTLREKYGFVLVGPNGETPADPRSAKLVAEKLLELHASAVCDLFEMKNEARHEWAKNFFEALVNCPKRLWGPTVIVLDEAHSYAPEKGQGESCAYGAVTDFISVARKRGFGSIFATQRLSKLSKNATAEMYNQAVGPTARQADRDRAAYEMGISGKAETNALSDALRNLEPGDFFFQGPAIAKDRILVQVGDVETSHGSASNGKYTAKLPPTPAKIKALLPQLADLPKQAEEKAKTEAELRREIRSLQAQIRQAPKSAPAVDTKPLEFALRDARESIKESQRAVLYFRTMLAKIAGIVSEASSFKIPKVEATHDRVSVPARAENHTENRKEAAPYQPQPRQARRFESVGLPEGEAEKLRSGAERMLAALAQWSPESMSEGQMRSHAGLKKSGTFSAYMSDLRRGGYIEEKNGMVFATEAGLEYCKHVPAAPSTTKEVLDIWRPKLRDGARRMLDILVESRGENISKEELGERAQLAKSGTFSAYLSDLKTARLVIVNRDGTVAANKETLFL
jgi:uncharacterized protein